MVHNHYPQHHHHHYYCHWYQHHPGAVVLFSLAVQLSARFVMEDIPIIVVEMVVTVSSTKSHQPPMDFPRVLGPSPTNKSFPSSDGIPSPCCFRWLSFRKRAEYQERNGQEEQTKEKEFSVEKTAQRNVRTAENHPRRRQVTATTTRTFTTTPNLFDAWKNIRHLCWWRVCVVLLILCAHRR